MPRAVPSNAVLALAKRMIVQLAKPLDTTIPITDPRVRLKGFGIPFSSPDTSGRWGHEWPGSRLTGDDMRRLAVLGNYARLPTNEVLHIAVGVLYEQIRSLMLRLLNIHEQTGRPLAELLDDVAAFEDAASPFAETLAVAADMPVVAPHRPHLPAAAYSHGHLDPASDGQPDSSFAMAAESPAPGPRVQQFFPFGHDEKR